MNKKLTAIALTGALTFGIIGSGVNSPFDILDVDAAMPQGEVLETQRIYGREIGAYIAGTVAVYGKQPGTVIFKLSPKSDSSWSVGEPLTLMSKMVLVDKTKRSVTKTEITEENGQKYLLAYVYVSDPTKYVGVDLYTNNGEFGYDPINYEAIFVEGKDLTKPSSNFNKTKKVYWEGAELKKGQIGKIDVVKPINLWKRDGIKLTYVRVLKPGENYRVYSYDSKFGGQYGLGSSYYITNIKGYITYKTPSKTKFNELINIGG